jgi:hypothetical protein
MECVFYALVLVMCFGFGNVLCFGSLCALVMLCFGDVSLVDYTKTLFDPLVKSSPDNPFNKKPAAAQCSIL